MTTEVIMLRAGPIRNKIVAHLTKHPGGTCETVAEALGIDVRVATAALSNLNKTGAVTRWRVGRRYAYMLRAQAPAPPQPKPKLILPEDPDHPRQYTLLMPEIDANVTPLATDERTALERRLAELEAFKAEAVAKHPDLIPFDYEAYRPALAAFYTTVGYGPAIGAEVLAAKRPLNADEHTLIDGLIAAAKLFPENAG